MSKQTKNKIVLIIVGYSALSAVLFVLIGFDLLPPDWSLYWGSNKVAVLSLLKSGLPFFLCSIASIASASIFQTLYKGKFAISISRMLIGFSLAFLVFFFFANPLMSLQIQGIGLHVFALVMLASIYYAGNSILLASQQITFLTLLRFAILLTTGLVLRAAILSNQLVNASIIADVAFVGFLFGAITVLFYPLKYSNRSALKKLGGWMGTGTIAKLIIGFIVGCYILLARPYFYGISANTTLIVEWLFIGLIAFSGYMLLRRKLVAFSAPIILESWKKHQQQLDFKSSDELKILSDDIEQFLNHGKKADVILFLFSFLFERKVPTDHVNIALSDLINYQDISSPHLVLSWEANFVNEENKERRNRVLKTTIKNLNEKVFIIN